MSKQLFKVEQISMDDAPIRTHWVDTMGKAEKIASAWEREALLSDCPYEQCSMVTIEIEHYDCEQVAQYLMSGQAGAFIA